MVQSIWDDVKAAFSHGNMVSRLIIVNVAVFIFVWLLYLLLLISFGHTGDNHRLFDNFIEYFCMSAEWQHLLTRPWGLITNMFLHQEPLHILFNMLFLFWFGRIVGDLIGDQRILPLYLIGGIAGALLFFAFANLLNMGQFAMGASAGVMAIVVAAGVLSPDREMHLLLIGPVRLKYVVLVLLILDLVSIGKNMNTGGHIAHLGGAAMGALFIQRLRSGSDWSIPVNMALEAIVRFFRMIKGKPRQSGPRMVYKNTVKTHQKTDRSKQTNGKNADKPSHQEELDAILDKIKQSGYDSLNDEEKEFLFNASKNK
jgi:membrane associated rhomboid family serine protease